MSDALIWFLLLEMAGIVALPWAVVLFRRLPDRGLTLAKPASLLVFSYALWVFGLAQFLPNTQLTAWAILLAAGAGSVWLVRRRWDELRQFLESKWPVLLTAELLFLGLFALWAFVVSGSPAIDHTEKPMDLMLLNAANQARFFPAEDSWLSGHSISYYYFGHIIISYVAKLSGIATSVAYNLGIVTIAALAGSVAFGLVYNLARVAGGAMRSSIAVGASAPALILLAGNFGGALEFVRIRGWGGEGFWNWAAIKGFDSIPGTGTVFPADFWWWFRSTRIIDSLDETGGSLDYTITEFPVFSFALGDLHGHVLAIPFLLMAMTATLCVYLSPEKLRLSWLRREPALAAFLALSGGAMAFINFWDFPTFLALLAGALLLKGCRDYPESLLDAARSAAAVFMTLLVFSVVLFLPFHLTAYSGQTSGVLPLQDVATRPFLLFIVLGLFIVLSLALLARVLLRTPSAEQSDVPLAATALIVAILPIGVWVATGFMFKLATDGAGAAFADFGSRLTLAAPGALIVGLASYCALALSRRRKSLATPFALMLIALAFYLLMGAELFHIVDSFGGAWRRMNTVFKFYYQAWLLLGVVAAFSLSILWSRRAGPLPVGRGLAGTAAVGRFAGTATLALLLAASFYYTAGAMVDRSSASAGSRTLDGLAFLEQDSPGEYAAIAWLRDEAGPGRIVEAVGDDYSEYGRISAATGRPALLGWKGHEIQWRGSHEPFAGREEDIDTIFGGRDPAEAKRLLEHYGVRYVYLGSREQERYGVINLPQYADFLRTVFHQDGVLVYEFHPAQFLE